jgi:exodeoxyribonuclease V alpha subunit
MSAFEAEVTIVRTRFANDSTGWAVVDALEDNGGEIVLVGPLTHLEARDRTRVIGTWVDDSRYGPQIKVTEAHPLPPADAESLKVLLMRVKHVGPKRAERLVERFGADGVLDAVDGDPVRAFAAAGLRRVRAQEAADSWESLRATRQLHMLLAPHGLAYLATRIYNEYGPSAHRVVRDQPYELTSVFGVGFQTADRIARGIGLPASSPERARAAAVHLLTEAERGGSTCMALEALLYSLHELLGPDSGAPVSEEFVDGLVDRGYLDRQEQWIYRRQTAELEAELARRVHELFSSEPSERLRPPGAAAIEASGLEPNQAQLEAVHNAFAKRLSLITGGPGTGKTACVRAIARCAVIQEAKVMLAAPTGRAAVRMSEASGVQARTVHSALGWIPGEGPEHGEDDPLACDLLVIDETSMANLELMVTLLRAVGPQTSVVLVGDADQLAPVGAGKPFAELVESGLVPTVRLTHIFRQAAGSMIVQGAHAIRAGRVPEFAPAEEMRRDLFMIERPDPSRAREEIVSLVSERLPSHYGVDPVRDIQVFAPVYRGEVGIDTLNDALRRALNPDGKPVRGGRLRIGDKLMMTGRNLHEIGLMNGTVLRLADEISGDEDDPALVLHSDEMTFRLPPEESDRLRLAYACSVHRGQGIELPVAVIVAHPAGGAFFLRREMLYTALTRAKLATVIVGTRDVVARAARTPDTGRRHSRLAERLAQATALGRNRADQ